MLLLPLAEALAPSPLAPPNLRPCRTASIVMRPDNDPWTGERFSKVEGRPSTPKRSRDLQKALDAADAKLDALQVTEDHDARVAGDLPPTFEVSGGRAFEEGPAAASES